MSYQIDNQLSRWGSSSRVSSHWTSQFSSQWYLLALFVLVGVHFVLSSILPPTEDELYYWAWSQNLSLSFYDHPPMVALLIRISTSIFGNTLFGIRFFATLIHFIIFVLIARITPGKKVLGLVLLTPLVLYGAVLMTPDVPLLLFWTLYLLWLVSVNKAFSPWGDDPISRVYRSTPVHWEKWVLGGFLLGLGLLSKYSMVLALPCTILVLWTKYRLASWYRGVAILCVVAFVVASPILIFNFKYHFDPLKFQWAHSLADRTGVFGEFMGGQIALLGALPLLMLGWVLLRKSDIGSNPIFHVCFHCFLFPFLFSLFQAAKTHVEANWAIMSYVAFWPLAQYLVNQNSIRFVEYLILCLGFLPPLLVSGLIAVHLVHPLKWVPPEKDRLAKFESLYETMNLVKRDLEENGRAEDRLFLPTYQLTSYFKYLGFKADQLFPLGRASQFTLEPVNACELESVTVLSETKEGNYELLNCFPQKQLLKEYSVEVRGKVVAQFYLIEYFRDL